MNETPRCPICMRTITNRDQTTGAVATMVDPTQRPAVVHRHCGLLNGWVHSDDWHDTEDNDQ